MKDSRVIPPRCFMLIHQSSSAFGRPLLRDTFLAGPIARGFIANHARFSCWQATAAAAWCVLVCYCIVPHNSHQVIEPFIALFGPHLVICKHRNDCFDFPQIALCGVKETICTYVNDVF